jgi:hypothetical protein
MRLALVLVVLAACGKQVNPDFCAAHPADDRCMAADMQVDAGTDARADAIQSACPTAYSGDYRIVDTPAEWVAAEADCADDGATTHLVVISTQAELDALAQYVDRDRYVGHTDRITDDTWLPVTGEPGTLAGIADLTQPPWGAGEPNEGGDVAVLAAIDTLLHDRIGTELHAYICECDAYAEQASNF